MFLSHVIKAVVDEGVKRSRNLRSMRGDTVQRRGMMGGNMMDQERDWMRMWIEDCLISL